MSMFASHSNAVPLSVTNPSLPRSPPHIEGRTFESQDTRLYPRVLDEQYLLSKTTFEKPFFPEWREVISSEYEQDGFNFPQVDRSYRYFEGQTFVHPIDKAQQAHLVERLVRVMVTTKMWLDSDKAKNGICTKKGEHWERMNRCLNVLKPLCEQSKSYPKVHDFLVSSLGGIEQQLQSILVEGPVHSGPSSLYEILLETTTLEEPRINDWLKDISSEYEHDGFNFPQQVDRIYGYFEENPSVHPIDKTKDALLVERLVRLVFLTKMWMDVDKVKTGILTWEREHWSRMNRGLNVLKSLCEKSKSYPKVHEYLEISLGGIKQQLQSILDEGSVHHASGKGGRSA
ncbi:hypothetical protein H0H93_006543 [Arthromyces matolae]|nr:hypothetical protein H0H93_006543 [Arthromyces matolae]